MKYGTTNLIRYLQHNLLKRGKNVFNLDHWNDSNYGYPRHTSMDHNIFNNGDINMVVDEERGTVFGTLEEREEMLEKIKEIAYKKKSAPIIARIDEMMRQINQQGKDNG